ncbi:hypothetical protein, partial [Streptococcus oralis]|uniref:hypothetical protein n=1 Tax=Streptococcus oralis TaxID=1303 RepID=UPI00228501C1
VNELVSLIHGERVFCNSWACIKENEIIHYYRCNFSNAKNIDINTVNFIIPRKNASEFLNKSIAKYSNSAHHEAIRNAINSHILPDGM